MNHEVTRANMSARAREAEELHRRSRDLLRDTVRDASRAGFSQRQIAEAIGRSQPEVSRLLRFHGSTPLGQALVKHRREVIRLAGSYGVSNVRVFGSVARTMDRAGSDIDLLVDIAEGTGL